MYCASCESCALWEDTLNGTVVCTSCGCVDHGAIVFGPEHQAEASSPPDVSVRASASSPLAEESVYRRWTKELSRYVSNLDRRAIAHLGQQVEQVVQRDLSLKYVLPTSLVLAVYFGHYEANPSEKVSVCDAMHVKWSSVNKLCKKINLKRK